MVRILNGNHHPRSSHGWSQQRSVVTARVSMVLFLRFKKPCQILLEKNLQKHSRSIVVARYNTYSRPPFCCSWTKQSGIEMRTSLMILALSLASLGLTYPLEADSWAANPDHLHNRQQRSPENCADPNQNPSADCWTTLGVDQYLQGSDSQQLGLMQRRGLLRRWSRILLSTDGPSGRAPGPSMRPGPDPKLPTTGQLLVLHPAGILRPAQHLRHLAILQLHLLCLQFRQWHRLRPCGCHRFQHQPHREQYCR